MCVGLSFGRSTPRIRGTSYLLASTLALLVAGIGADDEQPALAADQLAVFTNAFHAGSHFHGQPLTALPVPIHSRGSYFSSNRGEFKQGGNGSRSRGNARKRENVFTGRFGKRRFFGELTM